MPKFSSTVAKKVRAAACAGRFYPENTAELCRMVKGSLAAAQVLDEPATNAIIVPYAG